MLGLGIVGLLLGGVIGVTWQVRHNDGSPIRSTGEIEKTIRATQSVHCAGGPFEGDTGDAKEFHSVSRPFRASDGDWYVSCVIRGQGHNVSFGDNYCYRVRESTLDVIDIPPTIADGHEELFAPCQLRPGWGKY